MRWAESVALGCVVLLNVSAMLPPSPPTPKKRVKAVAAPTQGSGATLLKSMLVVPVVRKFPTAWDWTPDTNNPSSSVRFNQWSKDWTNARSAAVWKESVDGIATKSYTNTVDKNLFMHWQFVTASNTATLLESWRPKK